MSFIEMPDDLIKSIFTFFDFTSLTRSSFINRKCNRLAKEVWNAKRNDPFYPVGVIFDLKNRVDLLISNKKIPATMALSATKWLAILHSNVSDVPPEFKRLSTQKKISKLFGKLLRGNIILKKPEKNTYFIKWLPIPFAVFVLIIIMGILFIHIAIHFINHENTNPHRFIRGALHYF